MKFSVSVFLMALLSFATCLYLPWWSTAFVSFIVSVVIPQSPLRAFLSGFIALFLLWAILAWVISASNDNILAHKVSLLIIGMDSPLILILLTGLIGAMIAALASLAGSFLQKKREVETTVISTADNDV